MSRKNETRKLTREIGKNSTAWSILTYSFFSPAFTRNDIVMAISSRVESAVADALSGLLERGYIEEIKTTSPGTKKYYRLSEDGRLYLARNNEYFNAHKDSYKQYTYREAEKRKARLTVTAFIHGAGVRVEPYMKPEFAHLISLIYPNAVQSKDFKLSPLYANVSLNQTRALLESGIYYSMAEIREGLEKTGRGYDEFLTSISSGIILTKWDIYILYHIEGKTLIMVKYIEDNYLEEIRKLFLGKEKWHSAPICICTGTTQTLASTITTGYIGGKMAYEKRRQAIVQKKIQGMTEKEKEEYLKKENKRIRRARRVAAYNRKHPENENKSRKIFFNALDEAAYNEVYYVRAGKMYTAKLSELIQTNDARVIAEGQNWLKEHKEISPNALYLPFFNCRKLATLRKQLFEKNEDDLKATYTVITDASYADSVSQCLGPLAADFYDAETGGRIPGVMRYDRFGYALSGVKTERMRKANEKRLEESRSKGEAAKKAPVSFRAYMPAINRFDDYSREYDLSRSTVLEEALYYILSDEEKTKGYEAYLKNRLAFYDGRKIKKNPFTDGAEQIMTEDEDE